MHLKLILFTAALAATNLTLAADTVVYETGVPTGFFTPFTATTTAGTVYGDSGWIGGGSDAPLTGLNHIYLGLATYSPGGQAVAEGKADLVFTLNDGDPSGLVFGTGSTLYSTSLSGVTLPAASGTSPTYFVLDIPLPGVSLAGGFNNVGWSLGVDKLLYDGSFGFQNRGGFNNVGFMTANASQYTPGSGWSLFSFGPAFPADSANLVATLTTGPIPEPASFSLFALGCLAFCLRRR